MGSFLNRDGQERYMDDSGVLWESQHKRWRCDPDTFEVLPDQPEPEPIPPEEPEPIEAEKVAAVMGVPPRKELERMTYPELLKVGGIKAGPGLTRKKVLEILTGGDKDGSTDSAHTDEHNDRGYQEGRPLVSE